MADNNILQEHFWFTATAVGINAFLMSSDAKLCHWAVAPIVSSVLSAYAAFLIVHRSAAHAGKIDYSADLPPEHKDRTWRHKLVETRCNIKAFVPHVWWIMCELSGAFFYFLLILLSCAGVWLARYTGSGL